MNPLLIVRVADNVLWFFYWIALLYLLSMYAKQMIVNRGAVLFVERLSLLALTVAATMYGVYYVFLFVQHRLLFGGSLYSEVAYELTGLIFAMAAFSMAWRINRTRRLLVVLMASVMMVSFCDLLGVIPYPQSLYDFALFLLVGVPLLGYIFRRGFAGYEGLFTPS